MIKSIINIKTWNIFSECFSKLLGYNIFNAETTQIRNRRAVFKCL